MASEHSEDDHVDLTRDARTDFALAERFNVFADVECAPNEGMGVVSPTYALLSRHVATREPLLALARECRIGQPIPNLLLAAVKRLAADEPDSLLARLYGRPEELVGRSRELPQAFDQFCNERARPIVDLVRNRIVQTNEVRRCSHLMPAFGVIAQSAGCDLALIDIGAGAGLNLLWNQFDYRYSDGSVFGTGQSDVLIECESRGEMPRIPARFPEVSFATGVDLNPIDLRDEEQYRWLEALIWPDHVGRSALLANAREVWLRQTPRVEAGDAIELLPAVAREAPADAALCVFHCHTLNQFSPAARRAFAQELHSISLTRPVFHMSSEGERMVVNRMEGNGSVELLSVLRSPHGRWVQW